MITLTLHPPKSVSHASIDMDVSPADREVDFQSTPPAVAWRLGGGGSYVNNKYLRL